MQAILDKRASDARLECSKLVLAEKRKALDSVYEMALSRLVSLEKEDCLQLFSSLLLAYAEKGDEIFLAENFRFESDLMLLPVIEEKQLKVSSKRLPLDGGMLLVGMVSDKDLSFGAILALDRENNQAALAVELFN